MKSINKDEIYTLPAFELRTGTDSDEVNRGETKGATATSRNSSLDSVHKDSGNVTISQENDIKKANNGSIIPGMATKRQPKVTTLSSQIRLITENRCSTTNTSDNDGKDIQ